jgi:hypothetical protein
MKCCWCGSPMFTLARGGTWWLCWICDMAMMPRFDAYGERLGDVTVGPPELLRIMRARAEGRE